MKRSTTFFTLATIILAAATSRLLPHWPNFTPIMAMALVGGVYAADKRIAAVLPILAMMVSDVLLGATLGWAYAVHETQVWVYLSILLITGLGRLYANRSNLQLVLVGGTVAGVLFFIVTNTAVWFSGTMYPHTIQGLMMSYAAGLAFYQESGNYLLNGIVSTWLYGAVMVAAINILARRKHLLA